MIKMFKLFPVLLFSVFTLSSTIVIADSKTDAIQKKLQKRFVGAKSIVVKKSPIKSLYEVTIGSKIFYVGENGTFLIAGHMWNMETNKNLTLGGLKKARAGILKNMKDENMIVFSPGAGKVKHTITVFTDIDCPYCRLMHSKIQGYLKRGIKVRYMLFPRAAKTAATYSKAVSVWCSADRVAAFTNAKAGQSVAGKKCEHQVDKHVASGKDLGVTGTPAIFFSNGRVVPGYVEPGRLHKMLETGK